MSLFRGRLFAGALFAGALWGGAQTIDPPTIEPVPVPYSSGYTAGGWNRDRARLEAADAAAKEARKKRFEDEAIIMACVQFVLEQSA